jgi:hypothetical protein
MSLDSFKKSSAKLELLALRSVSVTNKVKTKLLKLLPMRVAPRSLPFGDRPGTRPRVSPLHPKTLGASESRHGPTQKLNGSELESRKSRSCQASRQGLHHGPKLPDDMQRSLGAARPPASGRDTELFNSNLIHR